MNFPKRNLMVEKLGWDSEFFGFPVGKITVNRSNDIDAIGFSEPVNQYKLIYVMCEEPIPALSHQLVDLKVTFKKDHLYKREVSTLQFFDKEFDDYQALLRLAYLSGSYSRFKLDSNFSDGVFEALYKRWIDKNIEQPNNFVIVQVEGKKIAGFVSLAIQQEVAVIGLIAVDPKFQGKGIGSCLLEQAESKACSMGCKAIVVSTQQQNDKAMQLYKKNGYTVSEEMYIYHYWREKD